MSMDIWLNLPLGTWLGVGQERKSSEEQIAATRLRSVFHPQGAGRAACGYCGHAGWREFRYPQFGASLSLPQASC